MKTWHSQGSQQISLSLNTEQVGTLCQRPFGLFTVSTNQHNGEFNSGLNARKTGKAVCTKQKPSLKQPLFKYKQDTVHMISDGFSVPDVLLSTLSSTQQIVIEVHSVVKVMSVSAKFNCTTYCTHYSLNLANNTLNICTFVHLLIMS